MKIKEVQDKVTDYDEYELVDPNSQAEDVQNVREINVFNAGNNDSDKSFTNTVAKVPSFRDTEQQSDISKSKPIHAELITFGAELFNKLKDKLSDKIEPDQPANPQPDVIVLQSSRTNSKSTLQSGKFEHAEPRRIEDIFNDIFRNATHIKETIATFVDEARAPVEGVRVSASHLHPKAIEKINKKSLATSTADWNEHKVSKGKNNAKEKQDSIINTVVSISITTIDMDTEGKKILGRVESTDTSNESMFFIKKNSEDDSETDIEMYTDAKKTETKQSIYNQLKLLQLEEDIKAVNILEKKLVKLQTAVPQSHSNRFFEKGDSQNLEEVVERDNRSAGDPFEVLSNLTDNKLSGDDTEMNVVKSKGYDVTHHKRLSFATKKKSKAYKRKDLLSYISKAQVSIQKSKLTLDDSESPEDDTRDVSKKSGQKSIEVLKTLQFDDESFSEGSINQCSPLKRTVFGETSYMRETKGNAIPRHYKNVSKQNKELMVASVMADKGVSMNPSMQSMKIQANLFTYNQGDLESELYSNSRSNLDLDKLTSVTSTVASYKSKSGSLRNLVTFSGNTSELVDTDLKSEFLDRPVEEPSKVLVFDHLNPLNNILLRPINYTEAHKYNPMKGDEKLCDPKQNRCINNKHSNQVVKNDTTRERSRNFEVRTVTIKQHRFTPKTAHKAGQRIRFSTPYSVDTKQPRPDTENITKLSDRLQNIVSSNPNAYITKAKKRICRLPTDKHRFHRSVKITPKPKTKMQKISNSPKVKFKVPEQLCSAHESLHCLSQKKYEMKSTKRNAHPKSKTRAKIWTKSKVTKPEQSIFVQQLIADYIGFYTGYENNNDYDNKPQDDINLNLQPKTESSTAFSQSGLSFSSSKNLNPMKDQSTRQGTTSEVSCHPDSPAPKVLVFDYLNSLNNVLLVPLDVTEAHKYIPMDTEETICGSKRNHSIGVHYNQENKDDITKDFEMQTVPIKQHRDEPRSTSMQEGKRNRFSKPHIVNTKEQAAEINSITKFSEITLQDHDSSHSHVKITKGKKRIRSPSSDKHRHLSFIEVNPKPVTKTQNISSSPKVKIIVPVEPRLHRYESAHSMMPEKNDTKNTNPKVHKSKTRGKRSSKSKGTKLEQTKTAEHFISDYTGDTNFKNNGHEKNLLDDVNSDLNLKSESLSAISQSGLTFTLSKDLNPTKDVHTASNTEYRSPRQSTMQDTPNWCPEVMCTTSSIKYDSDSGVNVVAKIDMLPFMGSQECEWETSPADTWSFRLLNGRLRLTARLAHRLHNATRTRVRGDTPLLDITVAAVQYDRVDLVARMCARFACETLRQMVSREVRRKCYASDIPPLLCRCAAVVRVALRWKKAMYDAKVRLAYTLDSCGNLSLKVANIPLRSVWEVTMRIGLVSDDASSVPCPRASYVRVQPVVSDVLVPAADVRRALLHTPKDWGHVPSTIWRVYRLLKHKKRDDDLFLA